MNVNTLIRRVVAAAIVSPVLFLGLSIPANGQQQPQQPAAQQQQVATTVSPNSLRSSSRRTANMGMRGSVPNRGTDP